MDEASKQYTAFTVGNLGFFECNRMPFGLCNAPATFQQLMQNCMGELNLIYCLIYLDDLIVFSRMEEEHLHQLHVIFDQLRKYNLKLKPSKCSLFKEKINYLADQVSKQGIWPSNTNLKAIAECAPLRTYTEIRDFLSLIGQFRWFIRGFARIAQPLNEHLVGEGASRKSESVSLSEEALEAFRALKQACMNSPVLAFANYTADFLLKTDASQEGLGAVLSQKQEDGWFYPVAYGSWALTMHEENYHSTKLEFLALKCAVTEHFKEYLLYQPFLVKTDNNTLMCIITTPNFDATDHQWVGALAKFNFWLEYQKGQDNAVADALSWITTHLGPEAVQAILDGATIGAPQRAEGEDPTVIEGDQQKEKEVWVTTGQVLVEMYVTNWATAQKEDPELDMVLQWLESKKKTVWGHSSGNMCWARRARWYGEIVKISLPSKAPSTYASPQKERMRISYSSWFQRCTWLPPSIGVIGMQDTKTMTVLSPCYKNVSGGQVWPSRWDRLSRPVGTASSMRVAPLRPLYAL